MLFSAEASSGVLEGQQSRKAAVGGTVCDKAVAHWHGNGGSIKNPEHCPSSVHSLFSGNSILTHDSRGYECELIVHSRVMDP
jgi:hypothetical protein